MDASAATTEPPKTAERKEPPETADALAKLSRRVSDLESDDGGARVEIDKPAVGPWVLVFVVAGVVVALLGFFGRALLVKLHAAKGNT